MLPTKGYVARTGSSPLEPFRFERREPAVHDVLIDILYCGVCHSDIHQTRAQLGHAIFPMVPGHEIVGRVAKVGDAVTRHKVGDTVGIGCMIDSCRVCEECREGEEQFCKEFPTLTYNGYERDGKTPTYGGYSDRIVADEKFVLRVSPTLSLAGVAPCSAQASPPTSPLRHWKVGKGSQVGVIGLGGLGHMAVKLAAAMGAEVTVLSSSEKKRDDAKRLGASDYAATSDPQTFKRLAGRFDLILNTVSAGMDYTACLQLLKRDGSMVLLGVSDGPIVIDQIPLTVGRRKLSSSMIGSIRETQEMLDFCAEHGIVSDVEVIPMDIINQAYDRVLSSDVRYRFVIDMKTLR